jgi:hypothetical protein
LSNRFRPGDKVKLTERAARGWNNGIHKTLRIDWKKRRGVVAKASSTRVYVIWDGVRSMDDPVPPHILELCKD